MAALFCFHRLRFELVAEGVIDFPSGLATNVLRGAIGYAMRRLSCQPQCQSAASCLAAEPCEYARLFEPTGTGEGPSGLQDAPRPFLLRAPHLDGYRAAAGSEFSFDLHLFDLRESCFVPFVAALIDLQAAGLGANRGPFRLQAVSALDIDGQTHARLFAEGAYLRLTLPVPIRLDLAPTGNACSRVRVDFLTPTELKHEGRIAARPEFPILLARIRDRLSALGQIYGRALELDWTGLVHRARAVQLTQLEARRVWAQRQSSKTGQRHQLSGFCGSAWYEGDLHEALPLLTAAQFVGVGRQTVWGKGTIAVYPGYLQ